jgi:hypothetical protein
VDLSQPPVHLPYQGAKDRADHERPVGREAQRASDHLCRNQPSSGESDLLSHEGSDEAIPIVIRLTLHRIAAVLLRLFVADLNGVKARDSYRLISNVSDGASMSPPGEKLSLLMSYTRRRVWCGYPT